MTYLLIFPLYVSCLTAVSYLCSYLGLPLTRSTYLLIHLVILVLSLAAFRRNRLSFSFTSISHSISVLIPSLIILAMLASGFRGVVTPPHNADAGNHFFMVSRILETHTLRYPRLFENFTIPSWYPLGLQNLIASWLSLMGTSDLLRFIFPIIWIITAFFPLSVIYCCYHISRDRTLSLLAGFVSLTFYMFPFNTLSWGGWSMILGLTLLWFAVGQLYRALHSGNPRDYLVLIGLLNGLFLTHTTEVFTFLLLAPAILAAHRAALKKGILRSYRLLLPIIALNTVLLLPLAFAGYGRTTRAAATVTPNPHYTASFVPRILSDFHLSSNSNYLLMGVFLVGLGLLLVRRRHPDVLQNTALLYLIWLVTVTTPLFDPLYKLLFPWLETERLYYTLCLFFAFTTSSALVTLWRHPQSRRTGTHRLAYVSVGLAIAALAIIPSLVLTVGKLKTFAINYSPATDDDVALLFRNRERCPVYLNEPVNDAGRFIPYISGNRVTFHGPAELLPDYATRLELLAGIASEAAFSRVLELKQRYPFDCIYLGAYTVFPYHSRLQPPLITSNPHLTLLDSQGGSGIFILAQDRTPQDATPSASLPLSLSAGDDVTLKNFLIGDIMDTIYTQDQIPLKPVGTNFDLYTSLPLKELYLTGQSATAHDQPCILDINGRDQRQFTLPPHPTLMGIRNLNLTRHQNILHFTCNPTASDSAAARFFFSTITLK